MTAVILALVIVICIAGWEAITWRRRAEELNDENLELSIKCEYLQGLVEQRPRIQFGPQLDKARSGEAEWSSILGAVQSLHDELPNGGLRVVPIQRSPR